MFPLCFHSSSSGSRGFFGNASQFLGFFLWLQESSLGCLYLLAYNIIILFRLIVVMEKKCALLTGLRTRSVLRAGELQGVPNAHGCACRGRLLVLCAVMASVMSVTVSIGK